jgi:hypothetical protein
MAMYAELADGRRLEFPDGTDPGVIQSTVKKLVGAAPEPAQEPGPGAGKAALIAAGRGADKVVQGVRQAYNWATGDQATLDSMAAEEADKDRFYKPLQEAHPIATGLGETLPMLAVPAGGTLKGLAAAGAIPGLLGYGSAQERLTRGATGAAGGVVGGSAGNALSRVLKPAGVGAAGASDEALAAASRLGYKPSAGQMTQNPAMQNFENYLSRSPGSSGVMQRATTANQTALNRGAAKAMGETADDLGPAVFGSAQKRIGDEFTRLGQVTAPKLEDDFINVLANLEGANAAKGPFSNKSVTSVIDKGLDLASQGKLTGTAYKEIRTELSNTAQAAFKSGDASAGQAYKSIVKALDGAAKGSLDDADKAAWDTARQQWAAFKTLSKTNVAEGGNISAARAAAEFRRSNPNFRAGGTSGELSDIARIGEAFKSVPNPNSGNLTQGMLYGNPITGLPMLAGNRLAASAYMSPLVQQYMARGLLDVGPTGQMLLGRAGGQAAVPATRGLLGVE